MTFTAFPGSNAKLTAATFQALITETRAISALKTSNGTAFPSTTVMANETGMAAAVTAGVTYWFDAVVSYEAGTTADIKLGWTFPTASLYYSAAYVSSAGAYLPLTPSAAEASGTAKVYGGLGIGTPTTATFTGFIVVTSSGTLQLQRAQSVSTAENTRINAGSWVRLIQAV